MRSIHPSKSVMIEIKSEPFEDLKSGEGISSEKKAEIRSKILRNSSKKKEKNYEKSDQIPETLENSEKFENSKKLEISDNFKNSNFENSSNFKKSENLDNFKNSANLENNQMLSQKKENFLEESPGGMQIYDFNKTIDDLKDSMKRNAETSKKNHQKFKQIEELKQEKNSLEKTIYFSQSFKNSKNWEDIFYETLKENVNNRLDYIKDLTYGLNLIEIINDFQGFSQFLIKTIINELNLPKLERKFRPMIEKPDLFIYNLQEEGVLIKLTGLNSLKIEDFSTIFKGLGNEFRANRFVLNRIIQNMRKNVKEAYYKVPLCCLIDYMGLRALVYCKSKGINGDKTLVLGFDSNDCYQKNNLLNENIIVSLSNMFGIRVFTKENLVIY